MTIQKHLQLSIYEQYWWNNDNSMIEVRDAKKHVKISLIECEENTQYHSLIDIIS